MDSRNMIEVDFGSGKAYEIHGDHIKFDIMNQMYTMMGLKQGHHGYKFPGCLPVSIEREQIHAMKCKGYLATEKTDGNRYFMFLTTYDDKNLIIMVDRKLSMYHVPMSVYDGLYKGSIIDGELVKNGGNKYLFNVFDTVVFCGTNVMQHNFHQRFGNALELMKMVFPSDKDPFTFQTKAFYPLTGFQELEKFSKEQEYHTDGYVFYPQDLGYIPFRNWDLFKWKPSHLNTVDFLVERSMEKQKYTFSVFSKGSHVVIQTIVLPNSLMQVELEYSLQGKDQVVVECKLDTRSQLWVPTQIRTDKTHANDLLTFQKTIKNIQENIQVSEFM